MAADREGCFEDGVGVIVLPFVELLQPFDEYLSVAGAQATDSAALQCSAFRDEREPVRKWWKPPMSCHTRSKEAGRIRLTEVDAMIVVQEDVVLRRDGWCEAQAPVGSGASGLTKPASRSSAQKAVGMSSPRAATSSVTRLGRLAPGITATAAG